MEFAIPHIRQLEVDERHDLNLGFTIVNSCYPMSVEPDADADRLSPVYAASSKDAVVRYTPAEKALLFKALFDTIPEFRSRIRIFSPRISLYALHRQYAGDGTFSPYPCRGRGIDFFFIDAQDGMTYPCGYRGHENMGNFRDLDLNGIETKGECLECVWECFRDPSELFGPLLCLASLLKGNRLSAVAAVFITNPISAPLVYGWTYHVGKAWLEIESVRALNITFSLDGLLSLIRCAPEIVWILTVGDSTDLQSRQISIDRIEKSSTLNSTCGHSQTHPYATEDQAHMNEKEYKRLAEAFIARDRFAREMGIQLVAVSAGRATARLEITEAHHNGLGMTQGGAVFTLADLAFAAASNSHGTVAVGINASISFVKATAHGVLTAQAEEITANPKLATYTVHVTDGTGEMVAIFQGMAYRKNEPLVVKSAAE